MNRSDWSKDAHVRTTGPASSRGGMLVQIYLFYETIVLILDSAIVAALLGKRVLVREYVPGQRSNPSATL